MKRIQIGGILISIFIFTFLIAIYAGSLPVNATDNTNENKTVRVGWFDSSFNHIDKYGRRSGYAYDYQQKIAAYTGWEYEYVEGSWPELFEMLKAGEIDLLSDVSYTKERTNEMLFGSYPMGAESYYLFISTDNDEIRPGQYDTINGKKVGVNKGSIQEDMFLEWEKEKHVSAEIVSLTGDEKESFQMLMDGEIDAYLSIDETWSVESLIPVERIGQSEYYFAVNKERRDLLDDLNYALSMIQEKDIYYNQKLYEKYATGAGVNAFLNHDEEEWLNKHGAVRVGYLDDHLPFCDADPVTGELKGALEEYLELAKDANRNATIYFETKAYNNTKEMLDALADSEIDCAFPVNMSAYDCEEWGVLVTSPIMQTEVYACIRTMDNTVLLKEAEITVAAEDGDINIEMFVKDHFPNWNTIYCGNTEECFGAVSKGTADAAMISSYRVASTEELREKYDLSAHTTGESMDLSLAVRRGDLNLYAILENTVNLVPLAMIEAALAANSSMNARIALDYFIKKYIAAIIIIIIIAASVIVVFLIRHNDRVKKEMEERISLQEKIIAWEGAKIEADKMINAMSADYINVYYVDLEGDIATCYRSSPSFKGAYKEGEHFRFSEEFSRYAMESVSEEDREGFLDFIKPENIRKALDEEILISYRYLANKDGYEHYELIRMASVNRNSESGDDTINAVGVGFSNVDSETRKELEKNTVLSEALYQAEEASAAKTAFLSSMSHEIRTPMNAIIGLNTITLNKPDLPDDVRENLEKINASADHLLHLINNILDMSRIESGRMVLRNEEFSFRDMLKQINTIIDGQCQEKELSYRCRIKGLVDDYYIGDDTKLKQVLLNILGNAVKYTQAPGDISFYVEPLNKFDDKASIRFVIKDTGVGMDKEFLPRVFDAFEQEDEGSANKYGSTGLGMAIAKRIIEMMNGNIEVESEKGKGTIFTVTVTLRVSDKNDDSEVNTIRPQDMRVLIIDDDPDSIKHTKAVFDEVGIVSDTCSSGREAYELLKIGEARQEAYNMIIVDWKMPDDDGVEVTRQIRKRFKDNASIIILTAYNWDDVEEEAVDAGVDGFMTKPLFASNVVDELSRTISVKQYNEAEPQKADLNGKRVLVAEDVQINAEIVKNVLGFRGMEVDHAENGRIAVDMFADSPEGTYDAILMDIRMPVMDGLKATEAIREMDRADAKTIPIIAMTANAFDEDVQRSLQAGLNAHLSKPIEPEHLFETLEIMITD